jgi:hypothetical protein
VNVPIDEETYLINLERAKDYLNTREILYCVDAFAGWDPAHRLKVRVICSRPYHALFMHTMLIRPSKEELANFGDPDARQRARDPRLKVSATFCRSLDEAMATMATSVTQPTQGPPLHSTASLVLRRVV